ncbi:MAG: TROVE domain-containing protein [Gemmataceae bacterium]
MNLFLFAKKKNPSNAVNEAGGRAYARDPKSALAQIAATGCFANTFYAKAEDQLDKVIELANKIDEPAFLAKLAIYAREKAFMKDMPAALTILLSKKDMKLFHPVFDRTIDNGRVLRTFFQMVRSGRFGRKCLSYGLQRAVNRWLNHASVTSLLNASIGNEPSLRDVLRASRPTPKDNLRRALFGWLAGKNPSKWTTASIGDLPEEVNALTAFRKAENPYDQVAILDLYSFRWDLLADCAKDTRVWKAIAKQMGPQALRMNLNTLSRHGVFEDPEMVQWVRDRLRNREEILRSKQFPYQYFSAFKNADGKLPQVLREALSEATEIACENVPSLNGPVLIGLDVSGSMQSPVTGMRGLGATSSVRCIDVAAVFAAAIARTNPGSKIVPFDTVAHDVEIDPRESILALSDRLTKFGGGGTDCSQPLEFANRSKQKTEFAGCVIVSDNESWLGVGKGGQTKMLTEWETFKKAQCGMKGRTKPVPKLVCIDIQPHATTQAPDRSDILNVGGFSDAVFNVVSSFLGGDERHFVKEIEAIEL